MRVLFINQFPLTGSGSGVYTANLAKSITRKGHKAGIVFSENRRTYEKYEGIKLYPVFFKNNELINGVGQADMNFPCFTSHPRSKLKFSKLTNKEQNEYEDIYYNAIKDAIEDFKPDIVHSQHVWVLSGISAEICRERGIPLIVTCHGTDLMGIADEMERGVEWGRRFVEEAVNYASKIITISRSNNEDIEKLVPDALPKTRLIINGVDTHVFSYDSTINKRDVLDKLGIKKEYRHIVCFVGRLAPMKRVNVLLAAAAIYENDDIATLISGDGELRDELHKMAKDLNLKNTYFLGNQPHELLREIYNISDCSLVQSKKEPFGLVALEALACGTPVIATNQGGLPEFVTEDRGILIEVDDHKGLAKAVDLILSGQKTFDREATARNIKENYSQDKIISQFEKVYEESMEEKKGENCFRAFAFQARAQRIYP